MVRPHILFRQMAERVLIQYLVTKEAAHPQKGMRGFFGADDGNRTRVFGLGSGHSAIELHLQLLLSYYTPKLPVCQEKTGHFFENALFFCFM